MRLLARSELSYYCTTAALLTIWSAVGTCFPPCRCWCISYICWFSAAACIARRLLSETDRMCFRLPDYPPTYPLEPWLTVDCSYLAPPLEWICCCRWSLPPVPVIVWWWAAPPLFRFGRLFFEFPAVGAGPLVYPPPPVLLYAAPEFLNWLF